jgi:hypothetical protein
MRSAISTFRTFLLPSSSSCRIRSLATAPGCVRSPTRRLTVTDTLTGRTMQPSNSRVSEPSAQASTVGRFRRSRGGLLVPGRQARPHWERVATVHQFHSAVCRE